MSNLKTYKFSALYEMSSGISSKPEQAGHGSPFVSFSTVFKSQFLPDDLPDLMDTSAKEKETYSIKEGDIFLTRTSETIDELGMSCVAVKDYPDAAYSGFLKRLRPTQTNITYGKFMAFYLRSSLFRKTMNNNAIMTLRASLNEQIFSYLDLILPNYEEQIKIGDLFFKINEKIKLNSKINQELEAMAKMLYDYWFVQFDFPDKNGKSYKASGGKMVFNEELKREIPEGWEVKDLEGIESNIVTGKTPSTKKDEFYNGEIPFITIGDIRGNMHITETEQTLSVLGGNQNPNKFLPKGSICVTCIASPGLVGFVTKDSQTNQQINSIICKNKEIRFYLYFYLKDYFKFAKASSGSTFSNMNKGDFSAIKTIKPNKEILISFSNKLEATLNKILINQLENQKLAELRDWLLPMLMNGQVTLRQAQGNAIGEAEEKVQMNMAAEPRGEYKKKK